MSTVAVIAVVAASGGSTDVPTTAFAVPSDDRLHAMAFRQRFVISLVCSEGLGGYSRIAHFDGVVCLGFGLVVNHDVE